VSFFAKLEQACALFIERAFAKSFPSDVEPAQIARKLVATMEARTRGEDGQATAPAQYRVFVSPSDYERLVPHQEYLERAWTDLVRELAGRVGVRFRGGEPHVVMAPYQEIPLGAVSIEIVDERQPARYALRMLKGLPPDGLYAIDGTMRVGRSDQGEIVLGDPSVSRAHAIVEFDAGAPVVRDLGSTNGTFVNGRRISVEPLRDGDELRFGNTRMRLESA
jgi:hypothetical protein